ncbi:recombinase family protein [Streptococcus agalactiae]|uniref:recombinase family protein n=1 Tax=Streptococcus agalactiae TaxID=1311 RepID=UPI003EF40C4C
MKKVQKIDVKKPLIEARKKVAAYARVSMETDRLKHSLSAQVSYYSKLIQNNPEWEFKGIYSDYGISGTSTSKRPGFMEMMEECEKGNIDIILTKSIKRFARNTVDLLKVVRHLKSKGIEVRFENENINSLSGDGELMLSILASFAQEESRSTSENIKWAIRKGYEKGIDVARNKKVYGYRYDGKMYQIKEDEAKAVRFMFQSIVDGIKPRDILKMLNEKGIKTWKGNDFTYTPLNIILRNEIYIGDRRMQKTFVKDPIKQNKVKNKGELPQYYIENCHEPIIDKDIFYKVQDIMDKRAQSVPTYPFTGKIICKKCGNHFTRRKDKKKYGYYTYWFCRSKKSKATYCNSINFKESELEVISAKVLNLEQFNAEIFQKKVLRIYVHENGDLEYEFYKGESVLWQRR